LDTTPLELELAGARVEAGAVHEMLAVHDARHGRLGKEGSQHALAGDEWRRAGVKAVEVEEVEGVVDHPVVAPAFEVILQRGEIGPAACIHRHDLTVHDELPCRQMRNAGGDRR
jgi:hypothetical protein